MKANKPYERENAKALLQPIGVSGKFIIKRRGVLPAFKREKSIELGLIPEYEVMSWKPAKVFENDLDAPNVKKEPALPFPFDARDLAAFMLGGVGGFVEDYYGKLETGPDLEALENIDPMDNFARKAVVQAYAVYREVEKVVGPQPLELHAKAERARKAFSKANKQANLREGVFDSELEFKELEFRRDQARASMDVLELEIVTADLEAKAAQSRTRRERAKASTEVLELKMVTAAREAKAAQQKWLEAMVRELLCPESPLSASTIKLEIRGPKAGTDLEIPESSPETSCKSLTAPNVQHSTKVTRRDTLTPVIEHAQSLCMDPWDVAAVWGQFDTLTAQKYSVLSHWEGKAVAYRDGDGDKKLTRKNLGDRLRVMRKRLS